MDAVWDFKDSVRNPNLPNMAKSRYDVVNVDQHLIM